MSYQLMNPEDGNHPVPNDKVENNSSTLPNKTEKNAPKRMGVSVLPTVPKSNDYTEYKNASYGNEVTTKVSKTFQIFIETFYGLNTLKYLSAQIFKQIVKWHNCSYMIKIFRRFNLKDEANVSDYLEIDEYEELPLKDAAEGYEVPT